LLFFVSHVRLRHTLSLFTSDKTCLYLIFYIGTCLAILFSTPIESKGHAMKTHIVCLGFLLFFSFSVFAQELPPLTTDSRVRITAPTIMAKPLEGNLAWIQPDTVVLLPRIRIPVNTISKFEISLGIKPLGQNVRNKAWKGALLGLGVVAAAAADNYDDWDNRDNNKILFAVLGGSVMGGTLGGIYGALHRPEGWVAVPPAQINRYARPGF
jgi:hypothetical protein